MKQQIDVRDISEYIRNGYSVSCEIVETEVEDFDGSITVIPTEVWFAED